MKKACLKLISCFLLLTINWSGLSAVLETVAALNDQEASENSFYQASTLDFSLSSLGDFSPELTPDQDSSRTISVTKEGIMDFDYSLSAENFQGELCGELNLKVFQNGTEVYNSLIGDFNYSAGTFTAPQDWQFVVSLNSNDSYYQAQTCEFDFRFDANQLLSLSGFSDTETIHSVVRTGTWEGVWIQTNQTDFELGTGPDVDTSSIPDSVILPPNESDTENISLLGTASASSSDSSHTPDRASDGTQSSYWKGTSSASDWWMVDFGGDYMINKVSLHFNNPPAQIPVDYQLKVTTSNTCAFSGEETVVTTITGNTSEDREHTFNPALAHCLRIYITNVGGQPGIEEVEVYQAVFHNPSSGTLISQPSPNTGSANRWESLSWTGQTPSGTNIQLEVSTSNDQSTWSDWQLLSGSSPIDLTSLPETNYLRWRASLNTANPLASPVLEEVRVNYSPGSALDHVMLNEFLVNPEGFAYGFDFGQDESSMPQGEWIELYNVSSDLSIDLYRWKIKDSDGEEVEIMPTNTNTGSTVIGPNDWLVVYLNRAMLDNDGDGIYLYDNYDNLADSYSYSLADYCQLEPSPDEENNPGAGDCPLEIPENKSYARIPDGTGAWQDPIPTPGTANVIEEPLPVMIIESAGAPSLGEEPLVEEETAPPVEELLAPLEEEVIEQEEASLPDEEVIIVVPENSEVDPLADPPIVSE